MNLQEAATLFRAWAYREGMLFGDLVVPEPDLGLVHHINNINHAGVDLLRIKQIQAVGFSDADEEIIVFLRRAAPKGKRAVESLPDAVEDFPIVYRQGATNAVDPVAPSPYGAPFAVRRVAAMDRYTCGSSISVGNTREAGTLGCLLRDAGGNMFGLSNNHVSGSCSQAPRGLPILAPGILDVAANGHPPFTIGFHYSVLPLNTGSTDLVDYVRNSDAAVFNISDPALVTSYQQNVYDTPDTVIDLVAGQKVEKVGRTTGHKHGTVLGEILGPFMVPYAASTYGFAGPVYFDSVYAIEGSIAGGRFSDAGDSGSLITHLDQQGVRHAVGILFAGMADSRAPGGFLTLALPIGPILQTLGMTLVSGHNI